MFVVVFPFDQVFFVSLLSAVVSYFLDFILLFGLYLDTLFLGCVWMC
jgi:hypothetical protein